MQDSLFQSSRILDEKNKCMNNKLGTLIILFFTKSMPTWYKKLAIHICAKFFLDY